MIVTIVRKNIACLLSKVCKSPVCSPHFFSTRSEKQTVICPKVYDLLLHKHHFSPELASLVASRSKSPEKADSILSFLSESGCSSTQLQKIVNYSPRILSQSLGDIKFKIKIFQDLGLSPDEIAKMMSSNQVILQLSAKSNIIPSLSVLKGLLGSDYDVARLLRKSAWPLVHNLEKTLVPNVEFLKSVGVPMDRILSFLYIHPRYLLIKPYVMRKSVEKVKELGLNDRSKIFIYGVRIVASMSEGMWDLKLQSFQEMGFSESDSLAMFKKFPPVFSTSREKIEKVKQLLLATGKFDMSSIVKYPALLGCSVEKRLEPRLRVLQILESKNLVKGPGLGTIYTLSEYNFFERYVRPYPKEVGQVFVTNSCVKDKS